MDEVDIFFLNIRGHPDVGKVRHGHERSGRIVSEFTSGCQNIEHFPGKRGTHD